jgi:outer membrane protein assembly factor BamB
VSRQFLVSTLILSLAAATAKADNWPNWRGPDFNGVSKETGLPTTWTETKNVAWKLKMPGKAGSTPIVWGDRMFLTSADGNDLVLLGLRTNGDILWKKKLAKAVRMTIKYDEANEASASPTTDGKHVYSFVGSGDLACHDFDGNERWHLNVQPLYGDFSIQHGVHQSPVVHGDRLYLVLLHANGHWVIALDKATGKEVWKVHRKSDAEGESKEAYSSPILWNTGKETQLVVLGADYTTAHRLDDGKEIWRLTDLNPKTKYSRALRIIGTPAPTPDLLVVPTARGGTIIGVKPGATGRIDPGSPFELWRKVKGAPDVPSPLVQDGLVYLPHDKGFFYCIDAKTGSTVYQERLHDDRYRASPVYADGKIYVTARDGNITVIKAGSKFELLATNVLPDIFTSSPVIADGKIYLRGFSTLYAIQAGK